LQGGVIGELSKFLAEGKLDISDRAVAVFGDDQFRKPRTIRLIIIFPSEKKHDDVCVLL